MFLYFLEIWKEFIIKGGTIRCLSNLWHRQVATHENKHEWPTPYKREPSICLFFSYRSFGGFEISEQELKAQILSISTNRNADL